MKRYCIWYMCWCPMSDSGQSQIGLSGSQNGLNPTLDANICDMLCVHSIEVWLYFVVCCDLADKIISGGDQSGSTLYIFSFLYFSGSLNQYASRATLKGIGCNGNEVVFDNADTMANAIINWVIKLLFASNNDIYIYHDFSYLQLKSAYWIILMSIIGVSYCLLLQNKNLFCL
jgi:hypothetical protein